MDLIGTIFLIILLGLFLFYGFRDRFKENARRFLRTLIATPLAMIAVLFGFTSFANQLKKWMDTGKL